MRLIDADALRRDMYQKAMVEDSDMQKWESGCWIRYKLFENVLEAQPTAQPERKTGKWVNEKCSECGQYVYHGDARNYCPNCGAKMEEEKPE